MDRYSLEHLADSTLLSNLAALAARDAVTTADLIAHIAEVEKRELYAPAGFRSMHAYCVSALHLSDCATYKRLTAARLALRFPALFRAVADGRLHLATVITLGPKLTEENAAELISAATHKTRNEIEILLAQRFPKPPVPTTLRRLPSKTELAPGRVGDEAALALSVVPEEIAPLPQAVSSLAAAAPKPAKLTPLAADYSVLQVTLPECTRAKLRRAQELTGHTCNQDVATVLDRALDALIAQLEKRKFAATSKPRGSRRVSANPRSIPAEVRRAVRARDGDRCAFVSADGHRCESRTRLEFDHVVPVAKGGLATIGNLRQLCRTHNRYEAEGNFGREFMRSRRQLAVDARASTRGAIASGRPGAGPAGLLTPPA